MGGEPFFVGVNLPWLRYGGDFGANAWQPEGGVAQPDAQRRVGEIFARIAGAGLTTVRWWVLGDGRAGLRVDGDGRPLGLDDFLIADLDAGFAAAARHGIRLLPVLIDFLWFAPARIVGQVQTGGRSRFITNPELRWRLQDTVFTRIFERYRRHPAVYAWDLVNEPEWATRGVGTLHPGRGIPRDDMEVFLQELVALGHDCGTRPLTVGLASATGLPLVRKLGLDFYQVHWYDSVDSASPLRRSVAKLRLDRPVLLGEFPTRGSKVPAADLLQAAQGAGYAGALAWSMLASDDFTDWSAETRVAMTSFARTQGTRDA